MEFDGEVDVNIDKFTWDAFCRIVSSYVCWHAVGELDEYIYIY